MSELEQRLASLAREIEWPETPELALRLAQAPERRRRRRGLVLALAALVVAVGIAFAVPPARSAILDFLRIGGVTVERVETLPSAKVRPLEEGLGQPFSEEEAEAALGQPFRAPDDVGERRLYARQDIVSMLIEADPPLLLSELRADRGELLLKKAAGSSTDVEWVEVNPDSYGVWISGGAHVVVWPATPPRLAGNVLIWVADGVTFRLEGPRLTRREALRIARELIG